MSDKINAPQAQRKPLTKQQEKWTEVVKKLLELQFDTQSKLGEDIVHSTKSLHNRYRERHEGLARQSKDAQKTKTERKRQRDELNQKIDTEVKNKNWIGVSKLRGDLEKVTTDLAEIEELLVLTTKADKRYSEIEKQEKELETLLVTLNDEIEQLGKRLADEKKDEQDARDLAIGKVSGKDAEAFTFAYDSVAKAAEHSLREVFPLVKITIGNNGERIETPRTYTAIDLTEYAIVYAMLEKAELVLLTSGLQNALAEVEKAKKQHDLFRAARTGSIALTPPCSTGSRLDADMMEIEAAVARLRARGYITAGEGLETRLDRLRHTILSSDTTDEEKIVTTYGSDCTDLLEDARAAIATMGEIELELAGLLECQRVFAANGDDHNAGLEKQRYDEFKRDRDLATCLEDARVLHTCAANLKNELLQEKLDKENLNKKTMADNLEELRLLYDALFKHNKDGSVKMITDTKTGKEKGDKKDRHLPREAIREIELMIEAAAQLIESGSIDALKKADVWLAGTKTAIQNANSDPSPYVTIAYRLNAAETELNGQSKSFMLGEKADLANRLANLRKKADTVFQRELLDEIAELRSKIVEHGNAVNVLKGREKSLLAFAKEVKEILGKCDAVLKKGHFNAVGGQPFEYQGYHGPLRERLRECITNIERRDACSFETAENEIGPLKAEAQTLLDRLERCAAIYRKGPPRRPGPTDERAVYLALQQSKAGQEKLAEAEQLHKPYTETKKQLQSDIKDIVKAMETLKLDPTEAKMLEEKRASLRLEVKSSKDYKAGLAGMEKLKQEYEKLKGTVAATKLLVDADLPKVAKTVADEIGKLVVALDGFADAVKQAGGQAPGIDEARIAKFVDVLRKALPTATVKALKDNAAIAAAEDKETAERKVARNAALTAVRSLMAVFDGFPAMKTYAANPFDGGANVEVIRRALPRVEIKLLTAIGA